MPEHFENVKEVSLYKSTGKIRLVIRYEIFCFVITVVKVDPLLWNTNPRIWTVLGNSALKQLASH
jgi:hypothetical protein